MTKVDVEKVTTKEDNGVENSQWVTESDYEKIRKSIDNWPEWKRKICNTSRPKHAKLFQFTDV